MALQLASTTTFRPSDSQLIDYLRRKIAGDPAGSASHFIRDVNAYSDAPNILVAQHASAPGTGHGDSRVWYFYSRLRRAGASQGRWRRTVGGSADGMGSWHPEGGQMTVEGSAGGYLKKFSYKVVTPSGTVKPGWLMVEYGIDGGCDTVICKIYKSPRGPGRNELLPPGTSSGYTDKLREIENFLMADDNAAAPFYGPALPAVAGDAMPQDFAEDAVLLHPPYGQTFQGFHGIAPPSTSATLPDVLLSHVHVAPVHGLHRSVPSYADPAGAAAWFGEQTVHGQFADDAGGVDVEEFLGSPSFFIDVDD